MLQCLIIAKKNNHNAYMSDHPCITAMCQPVSLNARQGVITYVACRSVCDAIKFFEWQKVCLITWSFPSEALDCLIFKGQRSNCNSWFLAVWRSPWLVPKKGFDHLIQFWSRSQRLLHEMNKWLPLGLACQISATSQQRWRDKSIYM